LLLVLIYVTLPFMNVSLTKELEGLVEQKVKTGLYSSASEVIREGLRLLQQRDDLREAKLNALRAEIQKGIDDLEAGRYRDGEEVMAQIKERLLERKANNG
jgi:antitoxin ParD1/3/4